MLRLHPVTEQDAREFATWRYPRPYLIYNSSPDALDHFLNPAYNYLAIEERGHLVGYCCFGEDARVPGSGYEDNAIDIGIGMRPDLTGKGRGAELLDATIAEGAVRFPGRPFRATIAAFNERARHLAAKCGFEEVERFRGPKRREYVVLVKR